PRDGELPGVAADLAVLDQGAPGVGLDDDRDPLAAVGALDLDLVDHDDLVESAFPRLRPSFLTISHSSLVTGWTERREPFWVTIIFSSPGVDLRVSKERISGNTWTKRMSTWYQVGESGSLFSS